MSLRYTIYNAMEKWDPVTLHGSNDNYIIFNSEGSVRGLYTCCMMAHFVMRVYQHAHVLVHGWSLQIWMNVSCSQLIVVTALSAWILMDLSCVYVRRAAWVYLYGYFQSRASTFCSKGNKHTKFGTQSFDRWQVSAENYTQQLYKSQYNRAIYLTLLWCNKSSHLVHMRKTYWLFRPDNL